MQQQQMQATFNSRMEPIRTHEEYPKYARSETKPVVRARNIIDQGIISDHPCSVCVELGQDCYRWESTFSKCAYCTSKDKKKEFCHLPGQEAAPAPERRKRRKITGNIYAPGGEYAASTADTTVSGTPVPTGLIHKTQVAPAVAEAGSEATLERVTALENQVSGLEAKVVDILVRLDEKNSVCVSSNSSTPQPQQAAAGASPTTSDESFEVLQLRNLSNAVVVAPVNAVTATRLATEEWVERSKTPDASSPPMQIAKIEREEGEEGKRSPKPGHTINHEEGYRPGH